MRSRRLGGTLLLLAGLVFLLISLSSAPRNNTYLALGVVFVLLGVAALRRS